MKLNELGAVPGEQKSRKRVGRGIGSGKGKTAGRGHKGQKSRAGVSINGFEGGQMPLYRRLPRRGFHNRFSLDMEALNLDRLQAAVDQKKLDAGKPITVAVLRAAHVVRGNRDGVRLLGRGELTAKLTLELDGASKTAVAAVEKAGGTITLTRPPKADNEESKKRRHRKDKKAKKPAPEAEDDQAPVADAKAEQPADEPPAESDDETEE
jgi:large subunit ribosomal protein L15